MAEMHSACAAAQETPAEERPVEQSVLSHRFYLARWEAAGFEGFGGDSLERAELALRGIDSIAQILMTTRGVGDESESGLPMSSYDAEGLHCALAALASFAGDRLGHLRHLAATGYYRHGIKPSADSAVD